MSEGPTGPPPEESPATPEPAAPAQPAAWETAPHQQPAEPAPAAPAYVPPPEYGAPPGYAAPVAVPPPRKVGGIIAAVIVVAVIVVAVIGYAGAGFVYANSKLDSAHNTYNTVVGHQNDLTDTVNSFNTKFTTTSTSATAADLQASRSQLDTVVNKSQAAGATIATDDASLVNAQSGLSDNSWLTVFNRPTLDHYSQKIGHERKALADAKTLAANYVLMGQFYQAFFDAVIDLDDLGTKVQASDFVGALAADSKLKTDLGKALQAANAPGLPATVKQLIVDFQAFATDIGGLIAAIDSGDASTVDALSTKTQNDVTKLQSYDFNKIGTDIDAYYKPTIDDFNSEISKANSM